MQAVINGFLPLLRGAYLPHAKVARIEPARRTAWLDDGRCIDYRRLIATMSLPALLATLEGALPDVIRNAAMCLETISLRCVNLGIRTPPAPPQNLRIVR